MFFVYILLKPVRKLAGFLFINRAFLYKTCL